MAISTKRADGADGYFVMNADFGSDYIAIGHARSVSVQMVVDNTDADGYLQMQVSNDEENWSTVAFVEADGTINTDGYHVLSGVDSWHILDASDAAAAWARLKYNRTSGTGGCNYYWQIKKH